MNYGLSEVQYIVIFGGVMSGLGKGIIASSLSHLLANSGKKVSVVKIDPYLNYDAGTMNPYQHGEVFVLDDGSESDLDLGNYERFLDQDLTGDSNITTGKVYKEVIEKERRGDYLGSTVQIIPHITNEIKERIRKVGKSGSDITVIEVGGTVGDIESMPFLEAMRQLHREEGESKVIFGLVTLIPEIGSSMEQKTKPTQHSVSSLRSLGIVPDLIFARSKKPLQNETRRKISLFTDVPESGIISVTDADSIYFIPGMLYRQGILDYISRKLSTGKLVYVDKWNKFTENLANPGESVKIAIVGKYTELSDAYISHREAFTHVTGNNGVAVEIKWVDSDLLKKTTEPLSDVNGILVPGGFGYRGIEGKVIAARYARENGIPFLGICLGFQVAVIEIARDVLGLEKANSAEFDANTPDPVIDLLPEQEGVVSKGATMRLGLKNVILKENSQASRIYGGAKVVQERHRHRYEVNPRYIRRLEDNGVIFSGCDEEGIRMEFLELNDRQNFIASQYHCEFKSRPLSPSRPHESLVMSALAHAKGKEGKLSKKYSTA